MSRDVFRFINELDDAAVERIAARLEFRATDSGYTALREAYFAKLPLAEAEQVLVVGCGTGVEVRALLRRSEFRGQVVGVDHSPRLIEQARRLTADEGLEKGVTYQVGDAHALDFADASFDVVLMHTLLSHVTNPLAVLTEAARVAKPTAVVAIFDGDYASLTFGCPDPDLAKRAEEALMGVLINNPRVMRDMPRLQQQAGLELIEATPHVYADIGAGGFFANLVEVYGPALAGSGLLAADEVERWRAALASAVAGGTFFGACNYYTYLMRRASAAAN